MTEKVGIVYNDLYAEHDTGNHPECSDRVTHTIQQLIEHNMYGADPKNNYFPIDSFASSLDEIRKVHSEKLVNQILQAHKQSQVTQNLSHIDGDTVFSPQTYDAALHAVGGNLAAIDHIMKEKIKRAFVLCRPPGHHSNQNSARGFCIFNNVAITAEYLYERYGLRKVAILDFDVHAGNGTEEIFYNGPVGNGDLLFISTHQHPRTLYPGTCFMDEIGRGKMKGKIVNVTFAPGAGQDSVENTYNNLITPLMKEFQPEFILISAGFDAHHADPLANLGFQETTYSYIINQLLPIANQYAQGRISCTLEGGYNIQAIANSITNVIAALAEDTIPCQDDSYQEAKEVKTHTENHLLPELQKILNPFWNLF